MGSDICCMKNRSDLGQPIQPPQINRGFPHIDDTTIKIIKIQSAIRGYLSKNKLNILFTTTITEITKELGQKKLINDSIILQSESYLIHNKLTREGKILPFDQIKKNSRIIQNIRRNITFRFFDSSLYSNISN